MAKYEKCRCGYEGEPEQGLDCPQCSKGLVEVAKETKKKATKGKK